MNLTSNKKCILLVRVSTAKQNLTQQTEKVKDEALKDGYLEENIIILEDKESAVKLSEEERNGIKNLKWHIEHDDISCVYTYEVSRISRQPAMLYNIRDYLIEHNVQLIILNPYMKMMNDDGTLSTTANIFFGVFSSLAENEGFLRKERISRGIERAKKNGQYTGAPVAIGYKVKNKRLVIDEEGAKIVRRIFEDYINGISLRKLVDQLQKEGFHPKTSKGSLHGTLYAILNREYYCGDLEHPAIITKEIFDKAREVAKNKTKYWVNRPDEAIFKGLIRDYNTGYVLKSNRAQKYYCYPGVTVSYRFTDSILWGLAKEWYSQIYIIKKSEFKDNIMKQIKTHEKVVSQQEKNISEYSEKVNRIAEMYIDGKINKEKADQLSKKSYDNFQECKQILNKAKYEIDRLKETLNCDNIISITEDMNVQEKIKVVNDVIKSIKIRRITNTIKKFEIYNRHTGEIRIIIANTNKMTIIKQEVVLRHSLGWNGE